MLGVLRVLTVYFTDGLARPGEALALKEEQTLAAVVGEALAAYLGRRRATEKDPPFQLLVRS